MCGHLLRPCTGGVHSGPRCRTWRAATSTCPPAGSARSGRAPSYPRLVNNVKNPFQRRCNRSPPFALQHKSRPVVRRRPSFLLPDRHLRFTQRRGRRFAALEHAAVELCHQFGGGLIVDFPEAGNHPRRARIHEAPRQPHQALALHVFSKSGIAGAEDDQFSGQIEVVDVVEP